MAERGLLRRRIESHPPRPSPESESISRGTSTTKGFRIRRPYKSQRPPSDYFKTNILVDSMGFNPIGLRAAVATCGADRMVFGSDYGAIPYGIEEHVQIVEDVSPRPSELEQVFWKTSNKVTTFPRLR